MLSIHKWGLSFSIFGPRYIVARASSLHRDQLANSLHRDHWGMEGGHFAPVVGSDQLSDSVIGFTP